MVLEQATPAPSGTGRDGWDTATQRVDIDRRQAPSTGDVCGHDADRPARCSSWRRSCGRCLSSLKTPERAGRAPAAFLPEPADA